MSLRTKLFLLVLIILGPAAGDLYLVQVVERPFAELQARLADPASRYELLVAIHERLVAASGYVASTADPERAPRMIRQELGEVADRLRRYELLVADRPPGQLGHLRTLVEQRVENLLALAEIIQRREIGSEEWIGRLDRGRQIRMELFRVIEGINRSEWLALQADVATRGIAAGRSGWLRMTGILFSAAGALIALSIGLSFVRRIDRLGRVCAAMARGQRVPPLPAAGDELGHLEASLSGVSELLAEREQNLLRHTRELEEANAALAGDIRHRERIEAALRESEEMQAGQKSVLETVAQNPPLDRVMQAVLEFAARGLPEGRCALILISAQQHQAWEMDAEAERGNLIRLAINLIPRNWVGSARPQTRTGDAREAAIAVPGIEAFWLTSLPVSPEGCTAVLAVFFSRRREPAQREIDRVEQALSVARIGFEHWRMRELAESQKERFRRLLEDTYDLVGILEPDGSIRYISESVRRALGYSAEDLTGHSCIALVEPRQREFLQDELRLVAGDLESRPAFEIDFLHRDGSSRTCEIYLRNLLADPVISGIVVNAHDVTDSRQAEMAVIASESRYRDLFENARDMLYTHDLAGNFTSLNRTAERLTGYTRDEALRMNILDAVAPEHQDILQQMINRQVGGDPGGIFEVELVAKSGARIPIEVSARLIFADGRPAGVQGIARDITERRQLETQLVHAQKMEAVGRLAGGVAHDFNNLLTVFTGYTQWILDDLPADSPLRESAEEALLAAHRAAALTNQLLAFSRKQVNQPATVDLNALVAQMERMLRRVIGEDVELSVAMGPRLGAVRADPSQIEMAILNLVLNARDAMPNGGKLIIETAEVALDEGYSRTHLGCPPGEYVMLAVTDTGCGMDAATQARAFEPFFTTKEKGKGTGLGLSTVYGVVKQSGGYVWLYSEPGIGTVFKLYLPRLFDGATSGGRGLAATAREGSETILLVEDESPLRRMVCEMLQRQGYRILEAGGGEAAIDICREHHGPIDLVLTDVVMPGIRGAELAEILSALRPGLKFLFMSGYTDNGIVPQRLLDAGQAFLQKPFTPDALAAKIRTLIESPLPQPRPSGATG
ncbi:MAG: PAS domain S-box protein [Bryobacterales bacterium]|nr:PAS domain S-box protein [Bryobacterales bacterium]